MSINKSLLLSVAIALTSAVCHAAPLTPDAALARIRSTRNTQLRLKMATNKPRLVHTQTVGGKAALYVFNQTGSDGFVILSADDTAPAVLGFSDSGTIDADNMAPAMVEWLKGMSEEISNVATGKRKPRTAAKTPDVFSADWSEVTPILTTEWAQTRPYNEACPWICTDDNEAYEPYWDNNVYAVTGCVATAMAQVMNYYQWPTQPVGTSYFNSSIDYSTEPEYKWNLMRDHYYGVYDPEHECMYINDSDWPSPEACATVAQLMHDIGTAVNMNYGRYGSGAVADYLVDYNIMTNNFSYDKTVKFVHRSNYSNEAWETLIYSELAAGYPLFYNGQDANTNVGHAFVCDGYKKELGTDNKTRNYFHINWGWEGLGNGYFLLTPFYSESSGVLDPETQSTGGVGENYASGQGAIVGLRKPGTTPRLYTASAFQFSASNTASVPVTKWEKSNTYYLKGKVVNGCYSSSKTNYHFAVEFKNISTGESNTVIYDADNELSFNEEVIYVPFQLPATLEDGEYEVILKYWTTDKTDLKVVTLPDGAVNPKMKTKNIFVLEDGKNYFAPTAQEYDGVTYKREFYKGKWNSWYVPFEISVDELEDNNLIAAEVCGFQPNADGGYNLVIKKVETGKLDANTAYFVSAGNQYTGSVVIDGECTMQPSYNVDRWFTIRGVAEYHFKGTYSKYTPEDGGYAAYIMTSAGTLKKTGSYVPAIDWYLEIHPLTSSSAPYNISIKLDDASTGITTADATKKDDGAAYNLNGQKVGKDYKGIVIRNGKKFMIK